MSTPHSSRAFEDLEGILRLAVEQVISAPEPAGLSSRLIERAAKWETPTVRAAATHVWWHYVAIGGGVATILLVAIWIGWSLRGGAPVERPVAVPGKAKDEAAPQESPPQGPAIPAPSAVATNDGITLRAGVSPEEPSGPPPFGGVPTPKGGRFAGASPSRWMRVAAEGTILVSTGGKDPIKLGAKHAYTNEAILHVWDWSKSDESHLVEASTARAFAVSPDGKWIVTADGQRIEIATSKGGRLINFDGKIAKILFSRDGRRLALMVESENNTASFRVIEFFGGKKLGEIPGAWPAMLPAVFAADGEELFVMGKDNFVRRWDIATGKELQKYEPAHQNSVRTMLVSPSGKLLVSGGSRGDILLWDVTSGKLLHKLVVEPAAYADVGVHSLAFSPDEKQVAGGGIGSLLLWNVETGEVKKFPRGSAGAEHIRFSADGKTLTTVREFYGTAGPAGEDLLVYPTVQEWDVETGKEREKK